MSYQNLRKRTEGFTIIEVLIVLAIAGLIMMVVFMAVPALQRNSRNSQRRNDISSMMALYQETVNNSNGQQPAGCTGATTTPPCWVRNTRLSNYNNNSAQVAWERRTAAGTARNPVATLEDVVIVNFQKCDAAGQNATSANATQRSVIALFRVETSGGTQTQCIES